MFERWMSASIQIFAQLSKSNVWKQHNQKKEQTYKGKEKLKNILNYVDFAKICNAIKNFTELYHNFVKEGITLTLLYSSRSIKSLRKY